MQNLVNKLQFYRYGSLICFDILVIDMHTSCMSNNVYNEREKKQKETIQKSRLYLSMLKLKVVPLFKYEVFSIK